MKESLGHTFSGDEALWHACLQQSELHGGQMKYAFHFKADVGAVSHVVSGSVLKSGLLPPASLRFPASMWIRGSLAWGYPCVGSPSLLSPPPSGWPSLPLKQAHAFTYLCICLKNMDVLYSASVLWRPWKCTLANLTK